MKREVRIIDRGRGPQLSTSRITVQDLVPYLQAQCTHEQIRAAMPTLTLLEIATIERYIDEHREAVMEQDRRFRERTEASIREQQKRFPPFEGTPDERLARLKQLLAQRHEKKNGERRSR